MKVTDSCTNSSKPSWGTSDRVVAPQRWPALMQKRITDGPIVALMSVPGNTMFGDLPPSSRTTFFSDGAANAISLPPISAEPVKLTTSTSGAVTTCSVTAGGPKTRLTAPGGKPASSISLTSATVHNSALGDGTRTAEHPE